MSIQKSTQFFSGTRLLNTYNFIVRTKYVYVQFGKIPRILLVVREPRDENEER